MIDDKQNTIAAKKLCVQYQQERRERKGQMRNLNYFINLYILQISFVLQRISPASIYRDIHQMNAQV